MATDDRAGHDCTAILRRRPVRIVAGRPEGGYASSFEVICFDCGDDPCRDYREVSPELQRIRGPYPKEVGIAAYAEHLGLAQHLPGHITDTG
jgi:hypothetical protein